MSEELDILKFEQSLEKLGLDKNNLRLAIAVSGGGDSMALSLLLNKVIKKYGGTLLGLTVDHGLRNNSAEEAAYVHEVFFKLGVDHKILKWEGEKPETRIEELARQARYKLLTDECKKQGFQYLAVAHNVQDLAETFWIRLIHASGLDGLASIAPSMQMNGVTVIRPLLQFRREELRDYCRNQNIEWAEDPFNQDEKFQRVKIRKFEDMLEDEGFTSERLSKTIMKLEEAKQSLEFFIQREMMDTTELNILGFAKIIRNKIENLPSDATRRIIAKAITDVYPQDYPLGYDLLESTRLEILDEDNFKGKSLAGCEIFPDKDGNIIIARESGRILESDALQQDAIWDKRFKVSKLIEGLSILPLNDDDLSELKKDKKIQRLLDVLPYKVKRGIPALKQSGKLLAVPLIGYYCPDCQENAKNIDMNFIAMEG